jgi:hypothetical protein
MMRSSFSDVAPSERWLSSALCAFRNFALFVCIIFVVGIVFLLCLKIQSMFWFFYELMFALSVISLFWIFPALAVGFSGWVCFGRFKKHYSKRSMILYWQCLLAVAVDVLLYFAMQIFSR